MVTPEAKEFLEINLQTARYLTMTMTQGRYGPGGIGVEYTEGYYLDYWRPGLKDNRRWKSRGGLTVRFTYINIR